jgi:hypothetical protein
MEAKPIFTVASACQGCIKPSSGSYRREDGRGFVWSLISIWPETPVFWNGATKGSGHVGRPATFSCSWKA